MTATRSNGGGNATAGEPSLSQGSYFICSVERPRPFVNASDKERDINYTIAFSRPRKPVSQSNNHAERYPARCPAPSLVALTEARRQVVASVTVRFSGRN